MFVKDKIEDKARGEKKEKLSNLIHPEDPPKNMPSGEVDYSGMPGEPEFPD